MQHNPVAIAIESLQQQWIEQSGSGGDFKAVRWLIQPEETALINGFIKLESSPYGQSDDFFLVLFTPYVCEAGSYSSALVNDLFTMWDDDSIVKQTGRQWDRSLFPPRIQDPEKADQLLIDVLQDFKRNFCQDHQRLIFGLLAKTIEDVAEYNDWIVDISTRLPDGICLSLTDYIGYENFINAANSLDNKFKTLKCGRFDMHQIASDLLSSQPNPENPQTVFQQCTLHMGKATGNKDFTSLKEWGAKALKAAQLSGSQSLLATAYLVYAGFMMQLKNKEALDLLILKDIKYEHLYCTTGQRRV